MNISELHDLWEQDSKFDRTELGEESLRIPILHSKYFKLYSEERKALRQWESAFKVLYKLKYEYYNGTISEEDLRENAWEPFGLRLLKTDIAMYLDADKEIIKARNYISQQQDKLDFLESIIKNLPARGYQIKSAIDWERFKVGA